MTSLLGIFLFSKWFDWDEAIRCMQTMVSKRSNSKKKMTALNVLAKREKKIYFCIWHKRGIENSRPFSVYTKRWKNICECAGDGRNIKGRKHTKQEGGRASDPSIYQLKRRILMLFFRRSGCWIIMEFSVVGKWSRSAIHTIASPNCDNSLWKR